MRDNLRIVSIRPLPPEDVYNMEVEDTHSFAVEGGIIVHNCYDGCRYGLMTRPWTPGVVKERPVRDRWNRDSEGGGAESWMAC